MRLLGLLLCLVTAPQGVLSQMQLQESGPGLVKPSQTLSLTCSVSGFSITSTAYDWTWIRQRPGKGLEWVGCINSGGSTYYSPSLKSRTSISTETSKNQFSLHLTSVTTEDTAVYYCAGRFSHDYGSFDYWGKGTMVTVSSVSSAKPTLFPLSLKSTDPSGHVVIGCLVQGFFPSAPMNVTWSQSGAGTTLRNFLPVQSSGGLYTMTSQLTLPANQCPESATQTCHVEHNSSPSQAIKVPCKVFTAPCPNSCCQPRLTLHRPALEDLLLNSNANLTCTLSGLKNPEGATFTWAPTGGKDAIQGTPESDAFGCYSVSSVLPGCAEPWNRGEKFTCTATHPESKDTLSASISKPSGSALPPQVHLLPPPAEELALNELVTLTCVVRGFRPEDVLLRWLHGGQELPPEKYLTWGPLPEASQGSATFAVTSVLRVEAENWKNGDSYSCMVGHEALPLNFTQKTIDRLAGKPTHVNVSVVLSEVDGTCY